MKRFFFTILFLVMLIVPTISFAQLQNTTNQTQANCSTVNVANYDSCCLVFRDVLTVERCRQYTVGNLDLLCQNIGSVGTTSYTTCCIQNNHANCRPQGATGSGTGFSGGQIQGTATNTATTSSGGYTSEISAECKQVMGTGGKIRSFLDILLWVRCVISVYILPILFSVGFIVFIYGVIKYVIASDVKEKEEGKKFLMWGLIGLFVMVSVWGIVALVSNTLGLENTVPQLQQNVYCEGGKKYDPVTQACR